MRSEAVVPPVSSDALPRPTTQPTPLPVVSITPVETVKPVHQPALAVQQEKTSHVTQVAVSSSSSPQSTGSTGSKGSKGPFSSPRGPIRAIHGLPTDPTSIGSSILSSQVAVFSSSPVSQRSILPIVDLASTSDHHDGPSTLQMPPSKVKTSASIHGRRNFDSIVPAPHADLVDVPIPNKPSSVTVLENHAPHVSSGEASKDSSSSSVADSDEHIIVANESDTTANPTPQVHSRVTLLHHLPDVEPGAADDDSPMYGQKAQPWSASVDDVPDSEFFNPNPDANRPGHNEGSPPIHGRRASRGSVVDGVSSEEVVEDDWF